jgi:hypothetical protein
MSSKDMRTSKPTTSARATKIPPSSTKYHWWTLMPQTTKISANTVAASTSHWRRSRSPAVGGAGGCASGTSATSEAAGLFRTRFA